MLGLLVFGPSREWSEVALNLLKNNKLRATPETP